MDIAAVIYVVDEVLVLGLPHLEGCLQFGIGQQELVPSHHVLWHEASTEATVQSGVQQEWVILRPTKPDFL